MIFLESYGLAKNRSLAHRAGAVLTMYRTYWIGWLLPMQVFICRVVGILNIPSCPKYLLV
jgi:hypothetical protein